MEANYFLSLVAIFPLLILFFLLTALKINSRRAAILALIPAVLVSLSLFGLSLQQLINALLRGASMSLFIILIVGGAIFLYNVVEKSGGFKVLQDFFLVEGQQPNFWLLLLLSWLVSSFIQGVSGFGVPVAVVGSLLVGLGYDPLLALASVLLGHSWSISFGSMGSSFYALNLVTELPLRELGLTAVLLFLPAIWSTGLAVAWLNGGFQLVKKAAGPVFLLGLCLSSIQALFAGIGLPHLATFAAGLAGSVLYFIFMKNKIFPVKNSNSIDSKKSSQSSLKTSKLLTALSPYLLLLVLVPIFQIPFLQEFFSEYVLAFDFAGFVTARGYQVSPVEDYAAISLVGHPFVFLLLAALLGGLFLQSKNELSLDKWWEIGKASWQQLSKSAFSIFLLLLLSGVMNYSGMIYTFAQGIAAATGEVFPIFSPFIGVLGAFLTGSNTSSNVLFAALQTEIALLLEVSPLPLAAAQTVGGALGSAVAPAKIVLGTATAGEEGLEGILLKRCLIYTLISAGIVGILTKLLTLVF